MHEELLRNPSRINIGRPGFISPASARDSQQGWYCSTSGIGPLPSSRLPQHEIPSKDGAAVPPGTARSLRGRSDSAVRFMARVVGLIPGQPGSAGIGTFPGMAPPGSARSLRGRSPSVIRFCGRGRLTQPASARDSQQGWYCSTSGIGPSRANQTCLSTGNSVDVA